MKTTPTNSSASLVAPIKTDRITVQSYLQKRAELSQVEQFRVMCLRCRQPEFTCFCEHVQSFDPNITFLILMHPIEFKRRVATGRMSHLVLQNSILSIGEDFTQDASVNAILSNDDFQSYILYPGPRSTNLSQISSIDKQNQFHRPQKKLAIVVIDGTWNTSNKMLRLSKNLHHLQQICFTPSHPSRFRVRKQPAPECYSTIEAIHETIELIGDSQGFATQTREHDKLLYVFDKMVEQQLEFVEKSHSKNRFSRHIQAQLKRLQLKSDEIEEHS